jgi:hypothetical protein
MEFTSNDAMDSAARQSPLANALRQPQSAHFASRMNRNRVSMPRELIESKGAGKKNAA